MARVSLGMAAGGNAGWLAMLSVVSVLGYVVFGRRVIDVAYWKGRGCQGPDPVAWGWARLVVAVTFLQLGNQWLRSEPTVRWSSPISNLNGINTIQDSGGRDGRRNRKVIP